MNRVQKNQNFDNQNLSEQDFTNFYFKDCSFKNTILGNLTNTSFVNCDMTGADLSKAIMFGTNFEKSNLTDIKLVEPIDAFKRKILQTLLLNITPIAGWLPIDSKATCVYLLRKETAKYPEGDIKKHATEFCNYLANNKEACWEEGAKWLELNHYLYDELLTLIADSFRQDPRIWKRFQERHIGKYGFERIPEVWHDL